MVRKMWGSKIYHTYINPVVNLFGNKNTKYPTHSSYCMLRSIYFFYERCKELPRLLELHRKPNVFVAPTITSILRPAKNFPAIASFWAFFCVLLRGELEGFVLSVNSCWLLNRSMIYNIYIYITVTFPECPQKKKSANMQTSTSTKLRGVRFSCQSFIFGP